MDLSKIQNQYKSNAEKEQNNSGDFKQRYERLMCWGKYEDAYDLCIKSVNPFNAAEVKQCAERALGMMCKATRQFKPIIAPETVSYDYITDTLIANGVNKMRMRDDLTLGGVSVSIKESAETKQVCVKVSRFRKILFALMLIPLFFVGLYFWVSYTEVLSKPIETHCQVDAKTYYDTPENKRRPVTHIDDSTSIYHIDNYVYNQVFGPRKETRDQLWYGILMLSFTILISYPVFICKSYRKAMRIKQIVGNAIFDSVVERRIKNNSDTGL